MLSSHGTRHAYHVSCTFNVALNDIGPEQTGMSHFAPALQVRGLCKQDLTAEDGAEACGIALVLPHRQKGICRLGTCAKGAV